MRFAGALSIPLANVLRNECAENPVPRYHASLNHTGLPTAPKVFLYQSAVHCARPGHQAECDLVDEVDHVRIGFKTLGFTIPQIYSKK